MDNKRKDRRVIEHNEILIKPSDSGNAGGSFNAYTFDLSLTGARIATPEHLPSGSLIRLQISLARSNQTITLDGEVKWIKRREAENDFEAGIEFKHDISQTIMSLIRHLYGQENGIPSWVS
jgi:hypothetical protein